MADKKHHGSVRQRANRCASGNNYHVGEHEPLSPKAIGHGSAKSGPENTTQYQGCSDKADYLEFDVKLSDDERHRHAKSKMAKPSSKVPPVESTQSHRWMAFSGDSSSSNVRRCGGVISANVISPRCYSRLPVSRRGLCCHPAQRHSAVAT